MISIALGGMVLGSLLYMLFYLGQYILPWVLELASDLLVPPLNLFDYFPLKTEILGFTLLISYIMFVNFAIIQWMVIAEQDEPNVDKFILKVIFSLIFMSAFPLIIVKVVIPFNYHSLNFIQYFTKDDMFFKISSMFKIPNGVDVNNIELAVKQILILFSSIYLFTKLTFIGGKRIAIALFFYYISPVAVSSWINDDKPFNALITELIVWTVSGSFIFIFLYYGISFLTYNMNIATGNINSFSFVVGVVFLYFATVSDELIRPFIYKKMGTSSQPQNGSTMFSMVGNAVTPSSSSQQAATQGVIGLFY